MDEDIYVPVLHYGGRFDRSSDGILSYLDGNVKRFRPMDIDLLLLSDLEGFVKEVGFGKWEKLLWHDLADPNLDTGLNEIKDDADLNALRGVAVLDMRPKEFHVYVQHIVEIPVVVEEHVILDESSSGDSYESAEDEAYKPPPSGYEKDDSNSEIEMLKRKKKTTTWDGNAAGRDGFGQNSGPGPDLGSGPSIARKEGKNGERVPTSEGFNGPSVDPSAIEKDSDYERPYEYESEAFNNPVSSEDERRTAYDAFNEDT
ncbi:hypothetical protein PIB30_077654 [Stylosanthes scabra]|uniref:PB1-like domain-containing protein n=1 Tax=Stylosanthes scabra TaxID=79078 RepID=A0ABU6RQW3_9FABA|nr:hypothetical protein [Stylosanthes scabra]